MVVAFLGDRASIACLHPLVSLHIASAASVIIVIVIIIGIVIAITIMIIISIIIIIILSKPRAEKRELRC